MARKTYTFSLLRAIVHVFMLLITAGLWMFVAVPIELWRYFRN